MQNRGYILAILLFASSILLFGQISTEQGDRTVDLLIDRAEVFYFHRQFDSAIIYFKDAIKVEINKNEVNPDLLAKCLIRISNAYISHGSVDSAFQYLKHSENLITRNRISDPSLLAEINYMKGHLKYVYNEVDSAKYYLNMALAYCKSTSNDSLKVFIIKDFGNVEFAQHNYDSALVFYEHALLIEKTRKQPSELVISSLYQNMSISYAKKFEYENANYYFKTSLEIKKKLLLDNDILLINAYINYSLLLTEIGNFQKALEISNLAESLILSKFEKGHYLLAHIFHDRSIIFEKLGRSNQAIIYFEKALDQISKSFPTNNYWLGQIYSNIGFSYYNMGEFDRSLHNFYIAISYKPDAFTKVLTFKMMADCYQSKNNPLLAKIYYDSSLFSLTKYGFERTVIASIIYTAYGKFLAISGETKKAKELLLKSFELAHEHSSYDPTVYSYSLNNLADFYSRIKDNNLALHYYQLGLNYYFNKFNNLNPHSNPKGFRITKYSKNLYFTYLGKAKVLLNIYRESIRNISYLLSCIETCELAIEFSDSIRNSTADYKSYYNNQFNQSNILEIANSAYYEIFLATNDSTYLKEAFRIIEKGKALTLKTSIQKSDAIEFSNIPNKYITRQNNLRLRINYYNQIIEELDTYHTNYNQGQISVYKNLRFEAMVKYDSLISYLESEYPKYYELKYATTGPTIESIQQKLKYNSALINYSVSDTNIFIAVVTSNDFSLQRLTIDSSLYSDAMDYYRKIKKGGEKSQIIKLSNILYSQLIEPVEGIIKDKEHLIIIPDNYLHYIPFETLCKPSKTSQPHKNFSDFEYLIKSYAISYHYSADLWEKGEPSLSGRLLDHQYQPSFIGFAPVFENKSIAIPKNHNFLSDTSYDATTARSITVNGKTFTSLPFSKMEVESISKLYNSKGFKGQCVLNSAATEMNFKSLIHEYDVIHIATHAFSNDEKPEFSGMVFSQPHEDSIAQLASSTIVTFENENHKNGNDGILHAGEMYSLNLDADLVVLSACETGIGKLVKGEGMIAMTRGLIYSGTNNILYTLWKISDKHTHNFMVDFYGQILKGESYANALRFAKLQMIAKESTAFPKLWSGYMLIGQ